MRFNTYMVKSSVQEAFSIEPAVSGDIRWGTSHSDDDETALPFYPSGILQSNTKYTVTLDTGAVDLFGTAIPEETEFSFITRPE